MLRSSPIADVGDYVRGPEMFPGGEVNRNTTTAAVMAAVLSFGVVTLPADAIGQVLSDGAPVVSLAEARRRAASVDPNAVAARGRLETAAWRRRAALADVVAPNLNGAIGYTHFSEPFFNFGTGTISPNATSATVQASYTLLGAGKFGELRSSRAFVESAEANETAVRFRTALDVDAAYFAVLADRELHASRRIGGGVRKSSSGSRECACSPVRQFLRTRCSCCSRCSARAWKFSAGTQPSSRRGSVLVGGLVCPVQPMRHRSIR